VDKLELVTGCKTPEEKAEIKNILKKFPSLTVDFVDPLPDEACCVKTLTAIF
jgi:hypothetical protein